MKKHEIEEWLCEMDDVFSAQLEKLRLEVKTLKARLQELEDKPPPPQFDPFAPITRPRPYLPGEFTYGLGVEK